jgi:hypothetical protein
MDTRKIIEASRAIDQWSEIADEVAFKSDSERDRIVAEVADVDPRAAARLLRSVDVNYETLARVVTQVLGAFDASRMKHSIRDIVSRVDVGIITKVLDSMAIEFPKAVDAARYWVSVAAEEERQKGPRGANG